MAGACGRSNRSQSKAMIFPLGVRNIAIIFFLLLLLIIKQTKPF